MCCELNDRAASLQHLNNVLQMMLETTFELETLILCLLMQDKIALALKIALNISSMCKMHIWEMYPIFLAFQTITVS